MSDLLPGVIYRLRRTADGHYSLPFGTDRCEPLLGVPAEALHSDIRPVLRRIAGADRAPLRDSLEASARSLEPWASEFRVQHPQRGERVIEARARPQLASGGAVLWHGYAQDVTDRRLAEGLLAEERARREILIEHSTDGFVVVSDDARVLECNAAFAEMLGYPRDEILNRPLWDWDRAKSRAEIEAHVHQLINSSERFETAMARRDGSLCDVEVSANGAVLGGKAVVLSVCRDVTARRQAEAELRRRDEERTERARLTGIEHGLTMALARCHDVPEALDLCLQAALEASGLDAGAAYLRSGSTGELRVEHTAGLSPEERERLERVASAPDIDPSIGVLSACNQALEGSCGSPRGLAFVACLPIESGDDIVGALCLGTCEPGAYGARGEEALRSLGRKMNDAILRIRTEATLKDREDALRQAQKLEAIGRLAGGIAHDFNNILASILMNVSLLQGEVEPGCEVLEGLQELEADARRAASLTEQLLSFSRRSTLEKRPLRLDATVADMLSMLRRLVGEAHEVEFESSDRLPPILADEGRVQQVVMNLVVNARDAMPDGGRIRVRVGLTDTDPPKGIDPRPSWVVLSVADRGRGMDPETARRVFEPFFTTKAAQRGTGLGLATVHGVAAQHGGWVDLETAVGEGTEFRVHFPPQPGLHLVGAESPPRPRAKGGGERILVVEDDPQVRALARRTLRRDGYRVIEAADGPSALAAFEAHGPVDLVLSDMVMPGGMSGLQVIEALRERAPGLPAVLTSGYSRELVDTPVAGSPGLTFLAKPFGYRDLTQAVERSLGRDRPGTLDQADDGG